MRRVEKAGMSDALSAFNNSLPYRSEYPVLRLVENRTNPTPKSSFDLDPDF
jgi:hypothetical protein